MAGTGSTVNNKAVCLLHSLLLHHHLRWGWLSANCSPGSSARRRCVSSWQVEWRAVCAAVPARDTGACVHKRERDRERELFSHRVSPALSPVPSPPCCCPSLHRHHTHRTHMCSAQVGLDAAGKTTILYKLKLGEIVTTIPTIGEQHGLVGSSSWCGGGSTGSAAARTRETACMERGRVPRAGTQALCALLPMRAQVLTWRLWSTRTSASRCGMWEARTR